MPEVTKTCSRPGCDRTKRLRRGLCLSHYTMWHRALPKLISPPDSWSLIQEAMPGTLAEIASTAELHLATVTKIMKAKHADGLVHIWKINPPECYGGRYTPVFMDGPGIDKTISQKTKYKNRLAGNRRTRATRMARAEVTAYLMITAGRAVELT